MSESHSFSEYDYCEDNIKIYGQPLPPAIDLTKIDKMPIALFAGLQDTAADPDDVRWLVPQLGNVVHFDMMDGFDHDSFMLGKDMSFVQTLINIADKFNVNNKPDFNVFKNFKKNFNVMYV